MRKSKGFTLVEILLALAIIMVIALTAFFVFKFVQEKYRLNKETVNLTSLKSSIESIKKTNVNADLSNGNLVNYGAINKGALNSAGQLLDAWGSPIIISSGSDGKGIYYISYSNLSVNECIELSSSVSKNFSSTNINSNFSLKPTQANIVSYCANNSSTVVFSNDDGSSSSSSSDSGSQETYNLEDTLKNMPDATNTTISFAQGTYYTAEEAKDNIYASSNDAILFDLTGDGYNSISLQTSTKYPAGTTGFIQQMLEKYVAVRPTSYDNTSGNYSQCNDETDCKGITAGQIINSILDASKSSDAKTLLSGMSIDITGASPAALCSNSSFTCTATYTNSVNITYNG